MIWMQFFESDPIILTDRQAICPSTRVGTGSTRPVRHWVSASLERWCPLAKRRSCREKFERGDVPSLPYCIMYIVN